MIRWLIICALALAPWPALAQGQVRVTAGVTQDSFLINSSFTGAEIVVFGGIEAERGGVLPNPEGLDIAVIVFGPPVDITVRRKEWMSGIWVNRSFERFSKLPGFYLLATTKPVIELTSAEILAQRRIGLTTIGMAADARLSTYRDAILRQKQAKGLYSETVGAIRFLSSSVFRTTIFLPAEVPVGEYTIRVFAFRKGAIVGAQTIPFGIDKQGLERWTFRFSRDHAGLYALMAITVALLAGWLASIVFRERR